MMTVKHPGMFLPYEGLRSLYVKFPGKYFLAQEGNLMHTIE